MRLKSSDGSQLITDQCQVLDRWKEHFNDLVNRPSAIEQDALEALQQQPIQDHCDHIPTLVEIQAAIWQLKSSKAAGEDGVPPDVWKHGGVSLVTSLHHLFARIWEDEIVPQQLKDPTIITIYKNKESRSECGNYRGIFC